MLPWLLRIWRELPKPARYLYLWLRYGHFAIGVAALIRDQAGRVLIVHRTYSADEPWALPGGWLDIKDAAIDRALERELLEETGLQVKVAGVRAAARAGFAVVLLMETHLVNPASDFRASAEVSELAWAEVDEVARLSPMNARLLRGAGL
jgi:ADP-ribose pyrophosphatase YjhB (NUDIX family)